MTTLLAETSSLFAVVVLQKRKFLPRYPCQPGQPKRQVGGDDRTISQKPTPRGPNQQSQRFEHDPFETPSISALFPCCGTRVRHL